MSFTRHVGKHGDRKVAVVFREVPGEPHMCLVVYTELLNQHIHDPLIKCIDSDIGQHSDTLADALNRTYAMDGRPILSVLHMEGNLKKIQTTQVVMTPNPNTKIKLDELNTMLNEMQQGEAAVKRMAEMDKSRGMQDPADVVRRMRGPQNQPVAASGDALGDAALAQQRIQQAEKMEREAKGLLAESLRLMNEAKTLDPSLIAKPVVAPKVKKVKVSSVPDIKPVIAAVAATKRKYTKKENNVT
jgi:hypothetical protein